MPGKDRPSQLPEANRRRARRSRERRYQAANAKYPCRFCRVSLPTERGRSVHEYTRHTSPEAKP